MDNLPSYLDNSVWITELELLLIKHSSLGIGTDVYCMTYIELWGLFLMLKNLGN